MLMAQRQQHFMVVVIGAQGHINPARHLACRLARTFGVIVSIAIPIQTLRRMFPSQDPKIVELDGEGSLVSYVPYSDGIEEDGLHPSTDIRHLPNFRNRIVQSLTAIATDFSARGRPVTCMLNTLLLPMVADVARELGIPYLLFWIQPAAVFAIYHHFFNLNPDPSSLSEIPGLPRLQVQDLPSILAAPNSGSSILSFLFALFQEVFELIRKELSAGARPKVLLNTFDDLEQDVLSGIKDIEMISIGPLIPSASAASADLFQQDASPYMEWLDTRQERSVVYASFGSLSTISEAQLEEMRTGLEKSGRPYLWVLRRDSRGGGGRGVKFSDEANGMVVEWCDQMRVLTHQAIGCFVTHCGWNSMLESMAGGVPTVAVPQWSDQVTNARLAEEWGLGVRAAVNGDGVMEGGELVRCLELVMGEEGGMTTRRTTEMWREKARRGAEEGGSSYRNLRDFVHGGFGGSTPTPDVHSSG